MFSRKASPKNSALAVIIDGNVEPGSVFPGKTTFVDEDIAEVEIGSEKAQFPGDNHPPLSGAKIHKVGALDRCRCD